MMNSAYRAWKLDRRGQPTPLALPAGTLDALSRQLPQGVYSTFRTFAGRTRVLDLRHHLDRLYTPAAHMNIQPVVDKTTLRSVLARLLSSFDWFTPSPGDATQPEPDEARVRIILSTQDLPGAVFIAIEPLRVLSDETYQRGVRVVTSTQERLNPALKSTAFIGASEQARQTLAASGAFEALMLRNGSILEGLTSNFYYVRDGVLGTAGRGILPGVTRRQVLRLARAENLARVYRALRLSQVAGIDEALITSSSRGIVPVVMIDALTVGRGLPGPVTRRLMERYAIYAQQHAGLIVPY